MIANKLGPWLPTSVFVLVFVCTCVPFALLLLFGGIVVSGNAATLELITPNVPNVPTVFKLAAITLLISVIDPVPTLSTIPLKLSTRLTESNLDEINDNTDVAEPA